MAVIAFTIMNSYLFELPFLVSVDSDIKRYSQTNGQFWSRDQLNFSVYNKTKLYVYNKIITKISCHSSFPTAVKNQNAF